MRKYKNKILAVSFIGILICGFGFYYVADAAVPAVYVSPAALSKNVGETFDISIGVNTAGNKVCVIEGKVVLNKLSCQNVKMEDEKIMAMPQTSLPSCSNLSFSLGIPGCATDNKALFSVTAKAESVGVGTANFSGVDIVGEGVSISSVSAGGNYTLVSLTLPAPPVCSCAPWQNKTCGAGSCSSAQLFQTRICAPSGCNSESRCKNDQSCSLPPAPATTAGSVMSTTTTMTTSTGTKEETVQKEAAFSEGKKSHINLLASLNMVSKEITGSIFLTVIVILCVAGLVFIGIKELRLVRKKK